jgi:hypothetical protein
VESINCPDRDCGQVISYQEILLIIGKDKELVNKYEKFVLQHSLGILKVIVLVIIRDNK